MKKNKSLLLLLTFCLIMTSCKKDVAKNEQLDEAYYKAKLEKMVNLRLIGPTSPTNDSITKVSTFKEVYQSLKYLDNKDSLLVKSKASSIVETDEFVSKDIQSINSSLAEDQGIDYKSYTAPASNTAQVSGATLSMVGVSYTSHATIGYTWKKISGVKTYLNGTSGVVSSSASSPLVTYTGLGNGSGSATVTGGAGGQGHLSGSIQGSFSLGGSSWSFFIGLTGGYAWQSSGDINTSPSFITTLSATENIIP
ncbi:hypothetical protein ACSBL2_08830 [Pedobacter sp. AW31-3R]|uniref:hypothetical protein n=1 Tax=Pedobacter sp. AW31-3R TaxID=3445781 RepID=UPI003F9F94EC